MRLTEAQSRELLAKHDVYVTDVCNDCGKILGHVRFTRFGEKGEWCSRECRDGSAAAEHHAATRKVQLDLGRETRIGGRPRKYWDEKQRRQANARYQREFRGRRGGKLTGVPNRKKNSLASDSFHVSTEAEKWPLAIPIACERA